ncbi:MAG: RimK/LysX family protein [Candidatus Krumholzibacteriia bacterium]|nr:ATP-dependent zinc protease [bacterium]MCB9514915.1 ATP-dependent zinc protease [Candidatus Latescibacterota bacterium]
MSTSEGQATPPLVGWKERVTLPDWGITLKALMDPVSPLSTLSVPRVERVGRMRDPDGRRRLVLRLEVPVGRGQGRLQPVHAFYVRRTRLGEGLGRCFVVQARLALGEQIWEGELALVPSRRQHFLHLGRADLAGRFRLDPARSYLHPVRARRAAPAPLLPLGGPEKAAE